MVREALLDQERQALKSRREQKVMDAIIEATTVELAPELVAEEEQTLFSRFREQLAKQNIEFEQWMAASQKKPEEVQEDFRKQAEQRLRLRFGMEHLMEERNIVPGEQDIQSMVEQQLSSLPPEQREQAREAVKDPAYRAQLEWQWKVERLLSDLLPIAAA